MMNGFSIEEISKFLDEYNALCYNYEVDRKCWLSFMDFVILRTGIGLEKEIKKFKVKERIEDIDSDFK